jgi:hypothetical protein
MSNQPTWLQNAINEFNSSNHKDGDILTHDWIKYALQIPEPKNLSEAERIQWLAMGRVEAFKDWLLESRNIAIKSVRGQGYYIVPPRDQARVACQESMKMVSKGLRKGHRMLQHTRIDQLNDDEKRRHTDAEVRMSGITGMIKRQKKDVFRLFKH